MSDVPQRVRRVLQESLRLNVSAEELLEAERSDALLGLDSIAVLEFVMGLEGEFGIVFDPTSLDPDLFADLDRLTRYIEDRLAEAS